MIIIELFWNHANQTPNTNQKRIRGNPIIREQVLIPGLLWREKYDLVHFPTGTNPLLMNKPLVITIHDMIEFFEKVPDFLPLKEKSKRLLMHHYVRLVQIFIARKSSIVITVSEYSKNDIVKILGIPNSRIRVVPNAQSDIFVPKNERSVFDFRSRLALPEKFLLSIGSTSSRKNILNLLEIYSLLPKKIQDHYPLIILWTHSMLENQARNRASELGIGNHLRFLSSVSDQEMVLLYNSASIFVFPSCYEGFGLPILEAMSCGVPVIASNLTSIPEVAGNAALLVDPNDKQGFSNALAEILLDEEKQKDLIARGKVRSAQFSWKKTAQATINVYKEVIENQTH